MSVVNASRLSYSYGAVHALRHLDLEVREGSLYALLGRNGSGKTTLLQILMGLRRQQAGHVRLLGVDGRTLTRAQRATVGYVAEGNTLPGWMRLEQLEAYLAPLYPTWDRELATALRTRFDLDPRRKIRTLSRGEHMKAALLCALTPRPRLLLMDEPFTGMDALVKDDLVRGLLASASDGEWTVVISSHDVGELELLADWVGFLERGRMRVSEPMESLLHRFKRVTVVGDRASVATDVPQLNQLSVEHAGRRLTFLIDDAAEDTRAALSRRYPAAEHIEIQSASLREIFIALARSTPQGADESEVA